MRSKKAESICSLTDYVCGFGNPCTAKNRFKELEKYLTISMKALKLHEMPRMFEIYLVVGFKAGSTSSSGP